MVVATQPWDGFLTEDQQVVPIEMVQELAGKCVLITGAGGFLGSALARALAEIPVRRLVLVDIVEYGLYRLEQDLRVLETGLETSFVVGSVRDEELLRELFQTHAPQVIFHAAALKHVPLMESNVLAAASTNTLGTELLLRMATSYGAERFVLLSTDKAVEPISVMGATKRVAELLMLSALGANVGRTAFAGVRLCNVLGSTGSVAPLFVRQIAGGGPITVTSPDATRYFISQEKATVCLLSAGVSYSGQGLLIPKVASASRIDDLAKYLIGSASMRETDVRVVYSGLRVADKMHERFVSREESIRTDSIPEGLLVVESPRPKEHVLERAMSEIRAGVSSRKVDQVMRAFYLVVPEYEGYSAPPMPAVGISL